MVVAGTHTGVGKTTVSVGTMAALASRGHLVQPFKIGPDFIDPSHHRAATGRWSHNLDSWILDRATNRRLFVRSSRGADIAVVEGVMGLFDGAKGGSPAGSTAEMARWLGAPVVLVVDAWPLAGSVAALVEGYARFDPEVEIGGVVLNRVAGEGHAELLEEALAAASEVPVLGAIPKRDELELPERHLGLHLAGEPGLPEGWLEALGDTVEAGLDLDEMIHSVARPVEIDESPRGPRVAGGSKPRIAVAYDEAFCFYYRDNLERLQEAGAELIAFSPLSEGLPEAVDGVYLGGGYPENAPERLAANEDFLDGLAAFAGAEGTVYAECGGLMALGEWLETRDGERYPMAGLFDWGTRMREHPRLDYVEVTVEQGAAVFEEGMQARGHLFHHSEIVEESEDARASRCYRVEPVREAPYREGYATGRVLASYVHLHFASNPAFAEAFVEACRD